MAYFRHIISRPPHTPGNGVAKKAVQIARRFSQQKSYINSVELNGNLSLVTGVSPSQLLMGTQMRTTLLIVEVNFVFSAPNLEVLELTYCQAS